MCLLLEFIIDILEDDLKIGYKFDPPWTFVLSSMIHNSEIQPQFQKIRFIEKLKKLFKVLKLPLLPKHHHIKTLIHRSIQIVSQVRHHQSHIPNTSTSCFVNFFFIHVLGLYRISSSFI